MSEPTVTMTLSRYKELESAENEINLEKKEHAKILAFAHHLAKAIKAPFGILYKEFEKEKSI